MGDTEPIRSGEELDLEKLALYLESNLHGRTGEIEISQFPSGASNLTYCVKIGNEELVLRRPPFGNRVKTAHDMSREFRVLSKLSKVYYLAPKPVLYCGDERVIGSEFYLMERRRGLIIRGEVSNAEKQAETRPSGSVHTSPSGLPRNEDHSNHPGAEAPPLLTKEGSPEEETDANTPTAPVPGAVAARSSGVGSGRHVTTSDLINSQTSRRQVCESFISNLADVHSLDYKAAGLGDLGKPEGYTRRQIEGWTKRYFKAKTDDWGELEKAIKWLNENIPDDDPPALVHNDYKFDNVMLNPEDLREIVAVLDWEMATIGSPLMDLGTTLAYWMSKDYGEEMLSMPFNPRVLMENVSREQMAERYRESSGRDVSNIVYYYVFGTFKVAVIAQQIYYRYARGFTKDKRFANFNYFVKRLGEIGLTAIEKKRI